MQDLACQRRCPAMSSQTDYVGVWEPVADQPRVARYRELRESDGTTSTVTISQPDAEGMPYRWMASVNGRDVEEGECWTSEEAAAHGVAAMRMWLDYAPIDEATTTRRWTMDPLDQSETWRWRSRDGSMEMIISRKLFADHGTWFWTLTLDGEVFECGQEAVLTSARRALRKAVDGIRETKADGPRWHEHHVKMWTRGYGRSWHVEILAATDGRAFHWSVTLESRYIQSRGAAATLDAAKIAAEQALLDLGVHIKGRQR